MIMIMIIMMMMIIIIITIIIHLLLSIYYPYIIHDYPWWWMWISWRQYWDSHPLASVEHVPRTLCQAPVRLPIGQWSPVTSCANLSGELSQDCPIIHMYIHIHVYIYIVYHSMVNLSQTDHHHGRLNHIYIYTHCFYISMCVPIIYTQDSFCFIADMSEKRKRRTVPGSGVSTHFRVRPCEL